MTEVLKNFFRYLVFRNIFISLCAVCMVWETQWFFAIPIILSPLVAFVFIATFFEYNLHVIAGRLSLVHPGESIRHLFSASVSPTLRFNIIAGFLGTLATFFMLEKIQMAGFVVAGLLTLSYSLPVIRRNGKLIRLREITYLKVFTVALGWTITTVVIPLLPIFQNLSGVELTVICLRRFLFIYAITIPFEIRDMERERRFGNVSLPMVYGVKAMKAVGIAMLILFSLLSAIHEKYFLFELAGRKSLFYPLLGSAAAAGFLVLAASDKKTNWYFKFWTDGTMILQFLLLLLFNP